MRVLFVVHGFPPTGQGGAEVYAEAHARTLRSEWGDEVVVLTREHDPSRPEYARRETDHGGVRVVWVNNTFKCVRDFEDSYTNPAIADIASGVVAEFRPDVAHVHHLTCLSTLIPERLATANVPCFMTLHDYWLLCHRGQLLDRDHRPCQGSSGGCMRCVDESAAAPHTVTAVAALVRRVASHLPDSATGVLRSAGVGVARRLTAAGDTASAAARRLAHMRDVARHVTQFFVPSSALRDRFIREGFPESRLVLSPYGLARGQGAPIPRKKADGRPLRLGFVGSLMISKAPHVLLEAVAGLPPGTATVDLFGTVAPYHGDNSFAATLEPLLRAANVTAHGHVPHDRMANAYSSMDALVVPSIWPENSPLVIQEAFIAGVPVIASDIGGIPELVQHDDNGLLFEPGNISALRDTLLRLNQEPGLLERLGRRPHPVRDIIDDVASMRRAYRNAPAHGPGGVEESAVVHAVVLNFNTPESTLLAVRSLLASRRRFATIMVVDNSENVECGRWLRNVSDHVEYFSTDSNLGYAGGMNVGIRRALARGATHVLLVNSDMTVPPDCLDLLLTGLQSRPDAGIAGPIVLQRSSPDRIDSHGLSYNRSTGRMRHRLFGAPVTSAAPTVHEVDAVSGCLMLVERRVFERAGLLDETYYFGFEDLDFCLRARQYGIVSLATAARALHEGALSLAKSSPDRYYYATRNHLRLARQLGEKERQPGTACRSLSILLLNAAGAMRSAPSHAPGRVLAVGRGAMDYWRGRFGPAG